MNLSNLITNYNSSESFHRPYMIAEAGVNHEGSMDIAKRLIEEAKKGGADAIKFQTYKAETLTIRNSPAYWDTSKESTPTQYELFKKHDKFWKKEFEQLKIICDEFEIEFLSTPFDIESADFLNDLMPVYKISSSDLSNFPFIEYICEKKKPIVLSTGASFMWEVHEVTELIERKGNPLALLHCVLNYPTATENAQLGVISSLKKHFPDHIIGYSDHTLPGDMSNLITATLLGARIIEKHFTHDKSLPGNDHYHAMNWEDMILFNEKMAQVMLSLGSGQKSVMQSEEISRANARRSLVAAKDIAENEALSVENVTWKRPGVGISPKHYKEIIGQKVIKDIKKDSVIRWTDIDN